jgi:hypothetical protein
MEQLRTNVAVRRIVFENDLFSELPCTSPPADDQKPGAAMPACNATDVPTPNPDGTTYWRE